MPQDLDIPAQRRWFRRYLALILYWVAFVALLYALTP